MRINRVELENYRVHHKKTVEFDRGINLLIGKNGAGKSSILEAIGLALFNADLRSNSQAEAIRHGSKTAHISIEFEGNDGNEYIIERKIGSGAYIRLFLKGDTSSRIYQIKPVLDKVKELSGLESNEKNLFQNVITAYQNKIVEIFSDTPTDREKTFNRIFDTAIYRLMYDYFSKDVRNLYSDAIKKITGQLEILQEQIIDTKNLKKTLLMKKEEKNKINKSLIKIIDDIGNGDKKLKKLEQIKNKIEQVKDTIALKKDLKIARESEKENAVQSLVISKKAKKTIDENKDNFNQYIQQSNELKELNKHIDALEKKEAAKNKALKKLNSIIADERTNQEKQKNILARIEEKKKESKKCESLIETINKEFQQIEMDLSALEKKGRDEKKLDEGFKEYYSDIKKNEETVKDIKSKLELVEKEKIDIHDIKEKIDKAEKERKSFLLQKEVKRKLEKELNELHIRVDENKKAEQTLSLGTCPFLNESCKNITDGSSPSDFFSEREETILLQKKEKETRLEKYDSVDNRIQEISEKITLLKNQLKISEDHDRQKKDFEIREALSRKEIENMNLKINALLRPVENKIQNIIRDSTYDKIQLYLTDQVASLRENYKTKKDIFNEIKKDLDSKIQEKKTIDLAISTFEKKNKEITGILINLEKKIKVISEDIQVMEKETLVLPELKQQRNQLNSTLEKLEKSHDLYMSHIEKSKDVNILENLIKDLEGQVLKVKKEMDCLEKGYERLLNDYSEAEYNHLNKLIKTESQKKDDLQKVLNEIEKEIHLLKRDFDQNIQLKKAYKKAKMNLSMINKKLELTDLFRSHISRMGKFVAARLMEKIEKTATENFRRITGRSEEIKWINNEKESYSVVLSNGRDIVNQFRFEVLSGGEQVAVALSLRAAMATSLTKANFAIFDEPTINLDMEKKVALSESLKEMLKNLNQAIIVTHDDSFVEMAQKIISLD